MKDAMASITITITDLPHAHIGVCSDAERPVIGHGLSPAQALAMELLGTAFRRGAHVDYDAAKVPLIALARDLVDPEMFGHAVTTEIRNRAMRALGREAVFSDIEPVLSPERAEEIRAAFFSTYALPKGTHLPLPVLETTRADQAHDNAA
jgi:hypothetical protein